MLWSNAPSRRFLATLYVHQLTGITSDHETDQRNPDVRKSGLPRGNSALTLLVHMCRQIINFIDIVFDELWVPVEPRPAN